MIDASGEMTGTTESIDVDDGFPVAGSLRLDIPFSSAGQMVLLERLYTMPENFGDTAVTAQIKLLPNGVVSGPSDTVRAVLILKSTSAYIYAAGTAVVLDPSAGWMTVTVDPDALAATFPFFTACDIRELDIEIDTATTGNYEPGTILIDSISIAPKLHAAADASTSGP